MPLSTAYAIKSFHRSHPQALQRVLACRHPYQYHLKTGKNAMAISNPTILTFDLATSTGWTRYREGIPFADTFTTKRNKGRKTLPDDHPGTEFLQFGSWVARLIGEVQPDLIVYEESFGHWKNILAALKPHGYRAFLLANAAHYKVPVLSVAATQLKKHATGKGNSKKPQMMEAARRRWPSIRIDNDNEADALCLLSYALSTQYGIEELSLS